MEAILKMLAEKFLCISVSLMFLPEAICSKGALVERKELLDCWDVTTPQQKVNWQNELIHSHRGHLVFQNKSKSYCFLI